MTCRPKSETAENEARMQQTLAAYRTKKIYKHFCNCHSSPSFMYHTQKSSQWSFFTPRKPPKLSSSHLYRRTRVRSMNIKVDNHQICSFSFINQTNDRINTKPSIALNQRRHNDTHWIFITWRRLNFQLPPKISSLQNHCWKKNWVNLNTKHFVWNVAKVIWRFSQESSWRFRSAPEKCI